MPHRSRTRRRAALGVAAILTGLLALLAPGGALAQGGSTVVVTEVTGIITPVVVDHLADAVDAADDQGATLLVVELDTPGGLVTSMRDIVQGFLNAPVPVAVYVTPSGADAGSAGTFITMAAHVAAMAPATTIGAATPVDLEGAEVGDKIVNNAAAYAEAVAAERGRDVEFAVDAVRDGRSVTADEAVEIGAVDLVVDDLAGLLADIDGRTIDLPNGAVTLATGSATIERFEMSLVRRAMQALADPNLAFIFISIGTLAIVWEVANPGLGAGGILGAILIVLAMMALSVLPVNYAGVALLLLALGLFTAELFIPGIGVGAAGGAVALLLGGLLLFEDASGIGIDLVVLVPTVLVVAAMGAAVGVLVARTRGRPSHVASDELIGREATVRARHGSRAQVQLDGTWWRVRPAPEATVADGDTVRVVDRDNLDLIVVPAGHGAYPATQETT